MADQTVNGVPLKDILNHVEDKQDLVERIAERKVKQPELAMVEPDPRWTDHFDTFKSRILEAFRGNGKHQLVSDHEADKVTVLSLSHVGSTSVPGLPAKAVIDIDLVLSDNTLTYESFYVPRLEAAGFQYLLREPHWYEHRFFCASEPMPCNLHVWGPMCAEAERHRIFRDWLREHPDDRDLYAQTKKECANVTREKGETTLEYTARKEEVIRQILRRAFAELGYLSA